MRLPLLAIAALFMTSPALAAEKSYDFDKIHALEVSGAIKLEVVVGGKQSVIVEEPDGRFEHIQLRESGGELKIETEWGWRNSGAKPEYTVRLVLGALDSLNVSGAIKGEIEGVKADDFGLDLSGASKLVLSGSCKNFDADMSGASKIEAKEFKCANVKIELSGAGKADIYASASVNADVSGAGNIQIYGNPGKVEQSTSGVAKIRIVKD